MVYILRSDGAYIGFTGMTFSDIQTMLTAQSLTATEIDAATFAAHTAI
jgi:hypothetical protein